MNDVIYAVFLVSVGLCIGWFLLPAPKVVQDFWIRMTGWFK